MRRVQQVRWVQWVQENGRQRAGALTIAFGAIALETQRVIAIGTNDSAVLETGFTLVTSLAQLSESVGSV